METCIFCKIARKEAKATIFFEDENCVAFVPLEQASKGHMLVIPKVHSKDIFDIEDKSLTALAITAKQVAINLVKEYGATGVNLLNASGKDAQQSAFHFHLHIIPRYPNDGLDMWIRNKL